MTTRGTKITGLNDLETVTGNIIIPVVDPTVTLATPDGQTLQSNVYQIGNYILQQAGNLFPEANVALTVKNNAQPNITSVGTLVTLAVSGNTSIGANLSVTGNISSNNISAANISSQNINAADISADDITANTLSANTIVANVITAKLANGSSNVNIATAGGNVTISVSGNSNVATFSGQGMYINGISSLGDISNVKIYGGSNHYVIVTDGTGNLHWEQAAVTAGPNTAVQFNDNGVFGGSGTFLYNKDTDTVSLSKISYPGGTTYTLPNNAGTSQQVLGITNQNTQQMGWKTVPTYYVTIGLRNGGNYLAPPNPVLRVYPVRQRDGSIINVNTTL
jgi:hypothetical protein